MRLYELRILLKNERIVVLYKSINQFLKEFENLSDDYELTKTEKLKLLTILIQKSNFESIISLRNQLNNELFNIVYILEKVGCLNEECLSHVAQLESFSLIIEILTLLSKAKIGIDNELIKTLSSYTNLYFLTALISTLVEANYPLTDKDFTIFLNKDYSFFSERNTLFKLLQKYEMLDEKCLRYICDKPLIFSFSQTVKLLSQNLLLAKNKALINQLINQEFPENFYNALQYLKKIDLLDQAILDLCREELSKVAEKNVFNLLELFDRENFTVSKDSLQELFKLSASNMRRFVGLVTNLIGEKLLDSDSFLQAYKRISEKLPVVVESSVARNSYKKIKAERTQTILDSKIVFFLEKGKLPQRGSYGAVSKGFTSLESQIPAYGNKQLLTKKPLEAKNEAVREVKYHRLLGRQAFYFQTKHCTRIIFDWQHANPLSELNNELKDASIELRLKCLRAGLSELNLLHSHYRVHGDLKAINVIIDLKNGSMKLIDFGNSHKAESLKRFPAYTYSDPYSKGDKLCVDLYAMSAVIMKLFPELYKATYRRGCLSSEKLKSNLTIYDQAVVSLVDSMQNADSTARCTSADAFEFCNEILKNFSSLDKEKLEAITKTTIERNKTTVEDILRGAKRMQK